MLRFYFLQKLENLEFYICILGQRTNKTPQHPVSSFSIDYTFIMLYVITLSILFGLKDAGGSDTMVPWKLSADTI